VPFVGRGHGLAYEPSYLASQLVLLALPLGAFALASGRLRLGGLGILLGVGGVWVTGSRAGIVGALVVTALAIGLLAVQRQWRAALIAVVLAAAASGAGWWLHRGNAYILPATGQTTAQAGNPTPVGDTTPAAARYAQLRGFGPRLACAEAALQVAREHPVAGSGLGLLPLKMGPHLPAWALADASGEIRAMHDRRDGTLPKPFAMAARIPGEFGLVGLAVAVLAVLAQVPWRTLRGSVLVLTATGLLALLFDSLFMASFALPGPWILLAALAVWGRPVPRPL